MHHDLHLHIASCMCLSSHLHGVDGFGEFGGRGLVDANTVNPYVFVVFSSRLLASCPHLCEASLGVSFAILDVREQHLVVAIPRVRQYCIRTSLALLEVLQLEMSTFVAQRQCSQKPHSDTVLHQTTSPSEAGVYAMHFARGDRSGPQKRFAMFAHPPLCYFCIFIHACVVYSTCTS